MSDHRFKPSDWHEGGYGSSGDEEPRRITASAPGTLMLMGEHAVLHGELAIACAVDQRIHVTLENQAERRLSIDSALATYDQPLEQLIDHPDLRFVIEAVRARVGAMTSGIRLKIESQFSHQVGLGSSAAVTVAATAAIQQWLRGGFDRRQVFDDALATMLAVQGRGSGTDLAASTYGALIAYRVDPLEIIPLYSVPEIGLYYSGYKTPTPEVLSRVASEYNQLPELYDALYRLMGEVTAEAMAAAADRDWPKLGLLMNYYQGLMESLGVNDRTLSDMVYRLREQGVLGAKISGSGLGDCVISLGGSPALDASMPYRSLPVKVAPEGVLVSVE